MKKTLLTLVLVVTAAVIFIIFFGKDSETPDIQGRPSQPLPPSRDTTPTTQQPSRNGTPSQPTRNDKESAQIQDITGHIALWHTTKDIVHLNAALIIAPNPDNESALDAWAPVLETEPEKLIEAVSASSTVEIQAIAGAQSVLDWYINLSGRYNSLSEQRKQGILRTNQQLELR